MTLVSHAPVLTTQDMLRLADESGVEFVDGHIEEKPVSIESSEVGATIIRLLATSSKASGEARVFDSSLGYKVFPDEPERFRKPDVSLIRTQRLTGVDTRDGFMRIAPDLAVEVLSPGDLAYDIAEKVNEYLRHGFRLVWVVQPNTRSVLIYRADGTTSLLNEQDEITGEVALPGFRCKVEAFFE